MLLKYHDTKSGQGFNQYFELKVICILLMISHMHTGNTPLLPLFLVRRGRGGCLPLPALLSNTPPCGEDQLPPEGASGGTGRGSPLHHGTPHLEPGGAGGSRDHTHAAENLGGQGEGLMLSQLCTVGSLGPSRFKQGSAHTGRQWLGLTTTRPF